MDTYPIYRKFQNGREFLKITSPDKMISVLLLGIDRGCRIQTSNNKLMIHDAFDPRVSMESNVKEFEKAYLEAMWYLNKANTVV